MIKDANLTAWALTQDGIVQGVILHPLQFVLLNVATESWLKTQQKYVMTAIYLMEKDAYLIALVSLQATAVFLTPKENQFAPQFVAINTDYLKNHVTTAQKMILGVPLIAKVKNLAITALTLQISSQCAPQYAETAK